MKKTQKYMNMISMLVLSFSLFLMVASCTDEDDEYKTELTKHKWYSEYTDYLLYGKDELNWSIQTDRIWLYFLADGTGIMSCRTTDKDTYFGPSRDEIAYRFNYTVSGNKVRLSFKDSGFDRSLTYSKDCLTDSENSTTYRALSFTDSELYHAKELADEQEFQASINHNAFQSLDVFIGFGNNLQPVKFTSYYLWDVSFSCHMPKDSQRRGITLAGLVIYVENGTITNKTGYDRDSECTVKVTTLDGKNAYYFEHGVYYDDDTQCGASMIVHSSSGTSLTIHRAYRYYDSVSKKYFTSPSSKFVLTGEGIDASEEDDDLNGNSGGNTGGNVSTDVYNSTGKHNGHEYVDLGLSVKWATVNVGAYSLEDYGEYYAWGETETKQTFNWSTYKWCKGIKDSCTKYCMSPSYGLVDNKTVLEPEDDVAHVKWGGSWRMPTDAEFTELRKTSNCTWKRTNQNGVEGYKVTSKKNNNSIFLPAAGYRSNSKLNDVGRDGEYWSSSLDMTYSVCATVSEFNSDGGYGKKGYMRYCGLSVRPVCP